MKDGIWQIEFKDSKLLPVSGKSPSKCVITVKTKQRDIAQAAPWFGAKHRLSDLTLLCLEQNWRVASVNEFVADRYEEGTIITYLRIKSQEAETSRC